MIGTDSALNARPDPSEWQANSRCRAYPTRWWFAGDARETALARSVCTTCPVEGPCLEFALSRPDLLGIWAATTPTQRASLRRVRQTGSAGPAPGDASVAVSGPAPAPTPVAAPPAAPMPVAPVPKGEPAPGSEPVPGDVRPSAGHPSIAAASEAARGGTDLLTPAEAARKLGVTPNTVTRWSRAGKIAAIQTMGGHRRFRRSEIERILLESSGQPRRRSPATSA